MAIARSNGAGHDGGGAQPLVKEMSYILPALFRNNVNGFTASEIDYLVVVV